MSAFLTPNEDSLFDAVWGFVAALFAPEMQPNIFKGFQNVTSTPLGSYIVVSPTGFVRQNQIARDYDPLNLVVNNLRTTTYCYQVDCYGPEGPDLSNVVAIAWRTMWACDYFQGTLETPTPGAPLPATPLYADEPQQLNMVNGELQYEQRFMCKLYLQANQYISLPQDFFDVPPEVIIESPADFN